MKINPADVKIILAEDARTMRKIEQAVDPEKIKAKVASKTIVRAASGKTKLRVAHLQITDHLLLGMVKERIKKGLVKPNLYPDINEFELITHFQHPFV